VIDFRTVGLLLISVKHPKGDLAATLARAGIAFGANGRTHTGNARGRVHPVDWFASPVVDLERRNAKETLFLDTAQRHSTGTELGRLVATTLARAHHARDRPLDRQQFRFCAHFLDPHLKGVDRPVVVVIRASTVEDQQSGLAEIGKCEPAPHRIWDRIRDCPRVGMGAITNDEARNQATRKNVRAANAAAPTGFFQRRGDLGAHRVKVREFGLGIAPDQFLQPSPTGLSDVEFGRVAQVGPAGIGAITAVHLFHDV
jgi:hypothetical protein